MVETFTFIGILTVVGLALTAITEAILRMSDNTYKDAD